MKEQYWNLLWIGSSERSTDRQL